MANEWTVFVDGLTDFDLGNLSDDQRKKMMSMAINGTARKYRTQAAREVRSQVNLPARYVSASSKGMYVSKFATPGDLEGQITARGRPTSLARFAAGSPKVGKPGVVVEVAPGRARLMKRAFAIKLPQGSASVETKYNLGLAIRLRPGESLRNKVSARRVSKGLYLLYGPSVDQVFRSVDGTGVANDLVPDIEKDLSAEFIRLIGVL